LLDDRRKVSPYQEAREAVEAWLDSKQLAGFSQDKRTGGSGKASWVLELEHPHVGRQKVLLSLPPEFPARPPEVHFSKELCLVWPHVEESGRFCHSVKPDPIDYTRPLGAVEAVLKDLERFWANSSDEVWLRAEFQSESLSYWSRWCDRRQKEFKRFVPRNLLVCLRDFKTAGEGTLAVYVPKGRKKRPELAVSVFGDEDAHAVSVRHGWAGFTLVRGHTLYVSAPDQQPWCPSDWPRTAPELEGLILQLTSDEVSLAEWVDRKKGKTAQPFLVVLVHRRVCYGYLLTPATVPRLQNANIVPVKLPRVDADWALARDHQSERLHARRAKRVLVLGCGSLGAPVAELLARAGVGALHLLDREQFMAENCSRHVLGAKSVTLFKSSQLASRLRAQVPEIAVTHTDEHAAAWVPQTCRPGMYDLVVDCTGESAVRAMLAEFRGACLGEAHLVHAWLEPFGAAAHVLYLCGSEHWPPQDLTSHIDATEWPDTTKVEIPACNGGFHPYGAADAWLAASLAAEKILDVLDGTVKSSMVWSTVRGHDFFDGLGLEIELRPWVLAASRPGVERVQVARRLSELGHHA
jgi:sulfur-carrier protein adenylyltransferase/sulfurtransferase